jgi:hypothetical protein
MTWTCHVDQDFMRDGVKILWGDHENRTYSNGEVFTRVADPLVSVDLEPLRLREDLARALLTALLKHFDGGEDTRNLRRDYDAERKRVDTFIAHLTVSP